MPSSTACVVSNKVLTQTGAIRHFYALPKIVVYLNLYYQHYSTTYR
jgi:hypothetical protein